MASLNKKYWKSVEELNENSSIVKSLQENEFVKEIPTDDFLGDKETLENSSTTRRDFLKYLGFSTAAASLVACEGPVIKSIPYVVQPDEIVSGVANYYATTIADGCDFASILIKTREGRPISVLKNDLANHGGAVNARVHASVLSMYDKDRLQGPKINGAEVNWSAFEIELKKELEKNSGEEIILLTQSFASPSTTKLIAGFIEKYPNIKHVSYDTISHSEALDAFQYKFGVRALADYDFSKTDVIISVGADFIGDWQGGGYEGGYVKKRVPENGKMSKHIHFESNMSLTGANSDKRVLVTPAEQLQVVAALTQNGDTNGLSTKVIEAVNEAKNHLRKAGSKAVIVTGCPDVKAQLQVLNFNESIASEAMDVSNYKTTFVGNSKQVSEVIEGIVSAKIKGLITVGVNPIYSFPSNTFKEAYSNLKLSVAFSMKEDETASEAQFVAATPHYLESWGDLQMKKNVYSLMQPTIRPLFNTKQFQDVLLTITENDTDYYNFVKDFWKSNILTSSSWNKTLQDGVYETADVTEVQSNDAVVSSIDITGASYASKMNDGEFQLTLYPKIGMGDGQQANNPWLQEFPDPISRTSWDNYLCISSADAKTLGVKNYHVANGALNGSYVKITAGDVIIEKVPVLVQPGQAKGSVGLSYGYGRKAAIQEEMQTGVNAYTIYKDFSSVQSVQLEKVAGEHEFACIQLHNTLMGRDAVRETTLEIFNTKNTKEWNPIPLVSKDHKEIPVTDPGADLWTSFDRSIGHHFNLSIDLNGCTGCGACVIACHAENNVPVVGKLEMRKSRDMHWLRIDRYYSSEDSFSEDVQKKEDIAGLGSSLSEFGQLEIASENPEVVFQPVMCQHCNHAPCETVCPVAATSHGRQGQNHMAYNRCVGTRYCANNCPYKVRRFNWFLYAENDEFNYNMNNDLGRMVLNPDVVVRSRGVMEKCSFCIQSTQEIILKAKREGRPVSKGEFNDACACSAACDTGAMRFGDVNEEGSIIADLVKDDRAYHLLEAVGTKPNVVYQTKVRNTNKA
jgi:molybdopterin-containing oxidoreductase family iron-sulfur binding subunit